MQVYIGIDWSKSKHDIAFLNESAALLAHLEIPHSTDGFLKMDHVRQKLGISTDQSLVAMETSHNLLVDFLWARGYDQVYVVHPGVVNGRRKRYRQSRARTDQSDAYLLADLLRTDRHRMRPWQPDLLLTRQIRAKVGLLDHLTRSKVRLTNRLRAVLSRYYPAALEPFSRLDSQIALAFINEYPTPEDAEKLNFAEFTAFSRRHRHTRPSYLVANFARLQAQQPTPSPETVLIYRDEACTLATLLLGTIQAKKATQRELTTLFEQHPDRDIFASLPGAGKFLAPALLAKFGDDRQRFPTAQSVQALAGTCPVTDQSGKRRRVRFRYACDRKFRRVAVNWAICSLRKSVWANAYYQQVQPRSHSKGHAYRCLANRWLVIAWKLWQTRQLYDEDYHMHQRAMRSKPKSS